MLSPSFSATGDLTSFFPSIFAITQVAVEEPTTATMQEAMDKKEEKPVAAVEMAKEEEKKEEEHVPIQPEVQEEKEEPAATEVVKEQDSAPVAAGIEEKELQKESETITVAVNHGAFPADPIELPVAGPVTEGETAAPDAKESEDEASEDEDWTTAIEKAVVEVIEQEEKEEAAGWTGLRGSKRAYDGSYDGEGVGGSPFFFLPGLFSPFFSSSSATLLVEDENGDGALLVPPPSSSSFSSGFAVMNDLVNNILSSLPSPSSLPALPFGVPTPPEGSRVIVETTHDGSTGKTTETFYVVDSESGEKKVVGEEVEEDEKDGKGVSVYGTGQGIMKSVVSYVVRGGPFVPAAVEEMGKEGDEEGSSIRLEAAAAPAAAAVARDSGEHQETEKKQHLLLVVLGATMGAAFVALAMVGTMLLVHRRGEEDGVEGSSHQQQEEPLLYTPPGGVVEDGSTQA